MPITTCVFDAYGTLFDVTAAAREAAAQPANAAIAGIWPKLAEDWRAKQLQYTWLRAITGAHTDFWAVTKDGLDWAMEANGLSDARLRQVLLDLYWTLSAYPEVPAMLSALKARGGEHGDPIQRFPRYVAGGGGQCGVGRGVGCGFVGGKRRRL